MGAPRTTVTAGTERLVLRYLAGFGPASRTDVASFTGLPLTALRPVLARLELCRFRGEDGDELLDVPDGPLPDPETPAPPRFLPTWDATLLVHARRTGVLPEQHRPKLFSVKTPTSFPTFLVDGAVAGTWRHERGKVVLDPFGPLDAADRRALGEEADRLAAFHA
ncbi:MAG: DNA glycosylase AlkZ-like family protein [Solirubrobacteraceae bacterium]